MRISKKHIRKALIRGSGIILLVIILLKLNVQDILQTLSNINIIAVLPLFFLFLALSYFKTKRWKLLLNNSRIHVVGKNLFSIYVGSFLIGAVTPGRLGEVLKYQMLMGKELDKDLGFVLSVQDRIWDLSFTLLTGSFFLVYVLHEIVYLLIFLPGLLVIIYMAMYPESFVSYVSGVLSKMFPKSRLTQKLCIVAGNMVRLSPKNLLQCAMFTVASWGVYFSQVYLFFRATGITYNFIFLSCVIAAAGLITLLPISIAGIGTRDMALVGLFSLSGKPPETAIVLSACILGIFFANCLISFPFWMYMSHSFEVSHS